MKTEPKYVGYTLVELLLSMALLSFLLLFVSVSFTKHHRQQQALQLAKQIQQALQFSRLKAYALNKPVVLFFFDKMHGGANGMALYVDNPKHQPQKDALLYQWHWRQENLPLIWHGFRNHSYLVFKPSLRESTINGTFLIGPPGKQIRLLVNRLGYTSLVLP